MTGLLGPAEVRKLAERLGVRPAKRLGQNFVHDANTVRRIVRLVDVAEYKRRQTPPGVRVTPKAFGRDRRMPITNGYR